MNTRDRELIQRAEDFEKNMKESLEKTASKETCVALLHKLKQNYGFFSLFQSLPQLKDNYPLKKSLEAISELYSTAREKAMSLGAELNQDLYPKKINQ